MATTDKPDSIFEIVNVGNGGLAFLDDYERHPKGTFKAIIDRTTQTTEAGRRPLWEGYAKVKDYARNTTGTRSAKQVSTRPRGGGFFSWLVQQRKPETVVEFGTAFGVSGMYWLHGIEAVGHGHLMTYEPNTDWAGFASENLASMSDRFTLTNGTFEENAARTLKEGTVGIAFIDAIHTSEFVNAQYKILRPYLAENAIVLFDDIHFSDEMRACWEDDIVKRPEIKASAQLGTRVGIALV
ncbi:MAG TPA: class I SAM-dependent methyltransferase [Octadecabacter sp.]|nr:class I SAM-dependent methyltransferase [Octadecabacter sp.]